MLFFRITLVCLFFLQACHSTTEKEHPIEDTHIFYSNYKNSKGVVIHKNIKIQTRLIDVTQELESLEKIEIQEWISKIDKALSTVNQNIEHLNVDGWKYITPKGILILAFTAAVVIPIPGTFETLTTIGFITMGVQRIREKEEDKQNRIRLSDLLSECSEANDKLTHLRKTTLPDYLKKWSKIFYNKDNHVRNANDPADIRVYDVLWNRYKIEKENLKNTIDLELEHANNQCYFVERSKDF
ncbi:MAG TPA: hypothetical protein PKL30_10975 [Leptospiraceae bacterium]|nr:hypothetical protein [Leptospiraceae bacterium]